MHGWFLPDLAQASAPPESPAGLLQTHMLRVHIPATELTNPHRILPLFVSWAACERLKGKDQDSRVAVCNSLGTALPINQ